MAEITLTKLQLSEGVWTGVLTGFDAGGETPSLRVVHENKTVEGVRVSQDSDGNGWNVSVPVPAEAIADGVQTVLIVNAMTDEVLGNFVLLAGESFDEDLRAEVGLLRAELDLLKRAFRRHCVETS